MRLTRSFVAQPLSVGSTITLPEDAAAHLVRVLRLQAGDPCVLFNGDGFDREARIASVSKREVLADIIASRQVDNESPLAITLLQGIARGEKMDLILQKATELGVARILPASSERSEVKLDAQRADKRVAHWREVVVSACEQSGRARVPEVAPPLVLAQAAALRRRRGLIVCTLAPTAAVSFLIRSRHRRCRHCRAASCARARWPSARKAAGRRAIANSWWRRDSRDCGWARASCAPKPPASPRLPRCRRWLGTWADTSRPPLRPGAVSQAAAASAACRCCSSAARSGTIASFSPRRTRANTPAGRSPPSPCVASVSSVTVTSRGKPWVKRAK